ncbi:hypothetical protein [Alkalibacterium sp. MB6]|nr:hypothetical protein [Alkalibacterium sp. MB6]
MKKLIILIAVFSYFSLHSNKSISAEENLESRDLDKVHIIV